MTGKITKRSTTTRKRRSLAVKRENSGVLERLTPEESSTILRCLLDRRHDLRKEAAEIATEMFSSPSVDDVAGDVLASVTGIGIDALNSRAGKKPWGYVEPTQAAWDLLEEAIEDVIEDMNRRMALGLTAAAETMCTGIVLGLYQAQKVKSDSVLGWAPDFPAEEACHALTELIRTCPAPARQGTKKRLLNMLAGCVPDWIEILKRAAERAIGRT